MKEAKIIYMINYLFLTSNGSVQGPQGSSQNVDVRERGVCVCESTCVCGGRRQRARESEGEREDT